MKKYFSIPVLVISLLSLILTTYAQKCEGFYEKKCKPYGKPYKISRQSKNAYMRTGQTASFKIIAFDGFEYALKLFADNSFENTTVIIKADNATGDILFSNSVGKKELLIQEFNVEQTQKLVIEITVEGSGKSEEEMAYEKIFGCVGIMLEFYKCGSKGF